MLVISGPTEVKGVLKLQAIKTIPKISNLFLCFSISDTPDFNNV